MQTIVEYLNKKNGLTFKQFQKELKKLNIVLGEPDSTGLAYIYPKDAQEVENNGASCIVPSIPIEPYDTERCFTSYLDEKPNKLTVVTRINRNGKEVHKTFKITGLMDVDETGTKFTFTQKNAQALADALLNGEIRNQEGEITESQEYEKED